MKLEQSRGTSLHRKQGQKSGFFFMSISFFTLLLVMTPNIRYDFLREWYVLVPVMYILLFITPPKMVIIFQLTLHFLFTMALSDLVWSTPPVLTFKHDNLRLVFQSRFHILVRNVSIMVSGFSSHGKIIILNDPRVANNLVFHVQNEMKWKMSRIYSIRFRFYWKTN